MKTEILIVEDEGLIALDLKRKLEQAGYTVLAIADNAEDAVNCVESMKPSLVLMDIRLRGLQDGVETADQIRRRFQVPVIFVTAQADRETLERARITEPFGYIVKPFHSVDFRAQIEIALWKHKMEQELRVSEAWLSMTFQNVADALIATDSEGNVAFMNRPAALLTGWNPSEAKGQPFASVFHACEEVSGLPAILPLIDSGAADSGKDAESTCPRAFQLYPRDGREDAVIVEAEFSANCDAGRLLGMIAVFRDVTERRRAERQNRQLQKMSALTLMATGLGRELAESQSQMDAGLKHLIEQSKGTTMSLLWDIFERSAHQQTVIQQLITLGKMDAGQTRLVDLNAFLDSMEEQMKKTLGSQRSLKLKLQPGVPPIETDPRYLQENILRLITDARRATAEGGVVEISTAAIDLKEAKGEALVVIRDNRKVLRAPSKERVFDPYYQSGPGKRNPGFSLALVYQFVASSGGRIEVESTPGEGSAYLLSFPAANGTPVPPDFDETRAVGRKAEHSRVAVAA